MNTNYFRYELGSFAMFILLNSILLDTLEVFGGMYYQSVSKNGEKN